MNEDEDEEDDESHESLTKRLKMSNVKDSEGKMNDGMSPTDMDEELVKTIRAMVDSVFIKSRNDSNNSTTTATLTTTTTTEGEGTHQGRGGAADKGENRLTTLNGSALQLLDRVQKELEKMASTGRSNSYDGPFDGDDNIEIASEGIDQSKASTEDNNPSLPNQQSSSSSRSSRKCTKVATNVLGWLCLDLKRVVQKATIESVGGHHHNQNDNRYHQLAQNGSEKIDTSDMTSFAASSRKPPPLSAAKTITTKDTGIIKDEYATLLCDETLPSSISGRSGGNEPSENDDNPSNRNDNSIQDEDGVSLLMCQESGLFAGDNINKPSASSSTDVPTATTSANDDSNTALSVQHQQTLAIIRETTRLLRTKTINLTKRRVEGTTSSRNNQENQKSSSTAAAASTTTMID